MSHSDQAIGFLNQHQERFVEEFREFLAIPSVSTLPEHQPDIQRAAEWIVAELRRRGMDAVEIIPTPGHPAIYAEYLQAPGKPTVLVYGHYDVQPVDPLDEWVSGPFAGEIRGDAIYARGASDMKGQIFAVLKALESLQQTGPYPVNLKFMLEGEEEIGSPNLEAFIEAHRERLGCDVVLNCDSDILAPDQPSITYALRGLAYFEIEVHGPAKDLHSGVFGGAVHNPAQVLCEMIAGMHDADGRVTLPGFYDKVRPLDDEERAALARLPVQDSDYQRTAGVKALWGEKGYTATERIGARPTLEVNGIVSGFIGQGSKTVLPAKALAKVSTRLVADQDPADIAGQLRAYLESHMPDTVTWEMRELSHGPGSIMDRRSNYMQAAVAALKRVFGVEPLFKRQGGSVPVVGMMQQMLGVDSVMLGFGLPDDGIHGPNEKQHLPTLFRGMETYVRFFAAL